MNTLLFATSFYLTIFEFCYWLFAPTGSKFDFMMPIRSESWMSVLFYSIFCEPYISHINAYLIVQLIKLPNPSYLGKGECARQELAWQVCRRWRLLSWYAVQRCIRWDSQLLWRWLGVIYTQILLSRTLWNRKLDFVD